MIPLRPIWRTSIMWCCGVFLVILMVPFSCVDAKPEGTKVNEAYKALLPSDDKCGIRSRKTGRVMWGDDAPLSAFPWMALIGYTSVTDDSVLLWLCGGTIICHRYVVTAAHCVDKRILTSKEITLKKIRIGEHNTNTDPDCIHYEQGGNKECAPLVQEVEAEKIIIHEGFETDYLHNDIALIRLKPAINYTSSASPICLPSPGMNVKEFLSSRHGVIAGWGATENSDRSHILQRASLPLQSNDVCFKTYSHKPLDEQLCFGGKGKFDSCFGDSGGPIMQARKGTAQYTFLGIVSYGTRICGIQDTPAIYTNVSSYVNWIRQNLEL